MDVKEWEVKARKEGFKTLYNWLENEREQPDALAIKTDRKPGLVVMLLDIAQAVFNKERTKKNVLQALKKYYLFLSSIDERDI